MTSEELLKKDWKKYPDIVHGRLVTTPPPKPIISEQMRVLKRLKKNPYEYRSLCTFQYNDVTNSKQDTEFVHQEEHQYTESFYRSLSKDKEYRGKKFYRVKESYHGYIILMCSNCFRIKVHKYDQTINTRIETSGFFDPEFMESEEPNIVPCTSTEFLMCTCEFCEETADYKFIQVETTGLLLVFPY